MGEEEGEGINHTLRSLMYKARQPQIVKGDAICFAVLRVQDVTDSGPDRGATRRPGAADRWGPRGGPGAERRWARGEDQEPLEGKMETDFTDNVGLTVKMPGGVYVQYCKVHIFTCQLLSSC